MDTATKARATGRIIYTDHKSRHGFIINDDANSILYFEHDAIDTNYHQFGERVCFDVENTDGRGHAQNITVVVD